MSIARIGKKPRQSGSDMFNALSKVAETAAMTPRAALPDLVFTANGGLVFGRDVILGHFMHRERRPRSRGFASGSSRMDSMCRNCRAIFPFEGKAMRSGTARAPFCGRPTASGRSSTCIRSSRSGLLSRSCRCGLVDKRFYHLDTCALHRSRADI